MRVVSGSARGTKLKTVASRQIRPTSDKVKESVFNILQFRISGTMVLDLFCGSGALGIEALSRGALQADFVDQSARSLAVAKENLIHTRLLDRARLLQFDWRNFLKSYAFTQNYDIIFADPPYAMEALHTLLVLIAQRRLLCEDGILVFEGPEELIPVQAEGFALMKDVKYGSTRILMYQNLG